MPLAYKFLNPRLSEIQTLNGYTHYFQHEFPPKSSSKMATHGISPKFFPKTDEHPIMELPPIMIGDATKTYRNDPLNI